MEWHDIQRGERHRLLRALRRATLDLASAGVRSAKAQIVWEPMWTKEMMSEVAKLQLGFF